MKLREKRRNKNFREGSRRKNDWGLPARCYGINDEKSEQ